MDAGIQTNEADSGQRTHTIQPAICTNEGAIRHRMLLTTCGDLSDSEISRLMAAIKTNHQAGNLYELLTGTNGNG